MRSPRLQETRFCLAAAFAVLVGTTFATAAAQPTVTARIGAPTSATPIPRDFIGLSVEITNITPDKTGAYMFRGANQPVIDLFRQAGIRNLRVGGGTAEPKSGDPVKDAAMPVPTHRDIDQLFAFAKAADVRVIYTLRLLNGSERAAVATAKYIMDRYAGQLDCFQIGNEPDWHAYHTYPGHRRDPAIFETVPGEPGSAYPSYLKQWRKFAAAIRAAVPNATFGGPDTGSNWPITGGKDTGFRGKSWTVDFAEDEKGSHYVTQIMPHDYVGQSATGVSVPAAVDAMLSRKWPEVEYAALYQRVLAPVQACGLPYRMTECNDHTGGVDGASNAFVSALWALDYAHWHAAHHAIGLNFHNRRWIYTCTIVQEKTGEYRLNPKAYGLRAFNLGSDGRTESLAITNPDGINLTGYAVVGPHDHFVTLINKEHGPGARAVTVTIDATGARTTPPVEDDRPHPAGVMFLTAPANEPTARDDITLGGDTIRADHTWSGKWTAVRPAPSGTYDVTVAPTSAAIVRIPLN
ncbi:MAG TPA: hypothetical protein VHE61_16990 [Opitutaceae bacterium]|nr:hypothetical protein [Opitutaceae bacterium]